VVVHVSRDRFATQIELLNIGSLEQQLVVMIAFERQLQARASFPSATSTSLPIFSDWC
jgi:hypothetical protein